MFLIVFHNVAYREADIERRDEENYTPLLLASVFGRAPTVDLLIQKEADITAVDKNDKTAIFLAAEENQMSALEVHLYHSHFYFFRKKWAYYVINKGLTSFVVFSAV